VLLALITLHAIAGFAVLSRARHLGRWGLVIGGLAPVITVVAVALLAGQVLDGDDVTTSAPWVPQLGLALDVRLDAFAVLMVVLVSGIGSLVFLYAWHYFGTSPRVGRAAGLLTLFAGSMLGVVLADNLLLLFVFWELTSITSYLLIGIDDADPDARSAALHALLVTGLGGLAMLGGFVVLAREAGTFQMS
jgi:multicomponent Na+:H+ antiporter subunit A